MKRRDFLASTALGSAGLFAGPLAGPLGKLAAESPTAKRAKEPPRPADAPVRKIFITGGTFGTAQIKFMAALTGKDRPRILYLPTASADRDGNVPGQSAFKQRCEGLNVEPSVQPAFISSYRTDKTWDEILLSVDAIVASGGNTLNQQAIWHAQGIDRTLRRAWDQGIVLGGGSAGSLCWTAAGTTDSRPKQLSIVECLGFIDASHSPHWDHEAQYRQPYYRNLIASGQLQPGYALCNEAGIYFEDQEPKRIVKFSPDAKAYWISRLGDQAVEKELPCELIS